jgi:hypothetical protein
LWGLHTLYLRLQEGELLPDFCCLC